jgi:hypothetical protein
LKDFLTTLYQGANVLIGLGQANIYDPKYIVDALDHYQEALLDWIGSLHPDQNYDLLESSSEDLSQTPPLKPKATQGLDTRRLLKRVFGPRITPEDFAEAYPDLQQLSLVISHGKVILLGERWNLEEEIPEGRVERQFVFFGGSWNVLRNYEPLPPLRDLNLSDPLPFRAPAWEPEETQRRLEKEFTLFQRLGVERVLPMDMEKPYWNIPFATFDWFKKRFSAHLGQFHKDISWQSILALKELYQIIQFRDEKTKAPVGAAFVHNLNVSWEGILSLPPNWGTRKRFEGYYAGRKAMEQRKEIEGRLTDLKTSLAEPLSSIKENLQKFASLVRTLSQQTALRHRIDLGWTGLHTLREHLARLESLRGKAGNKREKENLKKEIEKGIGLVEKALRLLPLLSEGPF